jgi:CRP-like cAMP-binding protein
MEPDRPIDPKLAKIGFLAGLSTEDQKGLFAHASLRRFSRGEVVLAQGAQNDRLFLVEEGTLHVRKTAKERPVILGRLEPGAFFGEMSLFDPAPTSAEVTGATAGVLLEIGREDLDRYLDQRPEAARHLLSGLLALLARRLRDADDKIADAVRWGGLAR